MCREGHSEIQRAFLFGHVHVFSIIFFRDLWKSQDALTIEGSPFEVSFCRDIPGCTACTARLMHSSAPHWAITSRWIFLGRRRFSSRHRFFLGRCLEVACSFLMRWVPNALFCHMRFLLLCWSPSFSQWPVIHGLRVRGLRSRCAVTIETPIVPLHLFFHPIFGWF